MVPNSSVVKGLHCKWYSSNQIIKSHKLWRQFEKFTAQLYKVTWNIEKISDVPQIYLLTIIKTVKPVLSCHYKRLSLNAGQKYCRMLQGEHLMQVKSIAECSEGSILQYFRPSLSYHFPLICLFDLILYVPSTIFQ